MVFWQWRTMPWPMPSARYQWRKGMIRPGMLSVSFGGAGGQHACGVAERLGMKRFYHLEIPACSVLMDCREARLERISEKSVLLPLDAPNIISIEQELIKDAVKRVPHADAQVDQKYAFVRLVGQDTPWKSVTRNWRMCPDYMRRNFAKYSGIFRKVVHSSCIHCVSVRSGLLRRNKWNPLSSREQIKPSGNKQFLSREDISVGAQVEGPCLVADDFWHPLDRGWLACD